MTKGPQKQCVTRTSPLWCRCSAKHQSATPATTCSQCRLTLAAESSAGFVPPSSGKSGAVGTETGSRGERALPAWPREAVFTWGFGRLAPGDTDEVFFQQVFAPGIWGCCFFFQLLLADIKFENVFHVVSTFLSYDVPTTTRMTELSLMNAVLVDDILKAHQLMSARLLLYTACFTFSFWGFFPPNVGDVSDEDGGRFLSRYRGKIHLFGKNNIRESIIRAGWVTTAGSCKQRWMCTLTLLTEICFNLPVEFSSGLFSEETHFNSVDGKHWMKHKKSLVVFPFDLLLGIHHKEAKQITADKKQRLKQDDKKKRKDHKSYLCITDCWPGIASL